MAVSSVLATLATVAGICVALFAWTGLFSPSRRKTARSESSVSHCFPPTLQRLLRRLSGIVATLRTHLQEHRGDLQHTMGQLDDLSPDKVTAESVVAALVTLAETNRRLQDRLALAESQIAQQYQELQAQWREVRSDPLTGLPNRHVFDQELFRFIREFRDQRQPFALAIFDVDHFKQINDTYGHKIGDKVLVKVAAALRAAAPAHSVLARIGGEEFALIWPHVQLSQTLEEAERVRQSCHHAGEDWSDTPPVSLSCGVAVFLETDNENRIFERADEALYAAKQAGRNCMFYHDGLRPIPWKSVFRPSPASTVPEDASDSATWDRDPEAQSLVQLLRSKLAQLGVR
ncbi:GGDEF domain-containing protein [Thermogutta sp.]|uniref:GGDEF domain-containing protein n=1 Tax=Thermogutta sp. TaxID=1962930 RepID=UPI00321F753C